jgi:hypothetical protein
MVSPWSRQINNICRAGAEVGIEAGSSTLYSMREECSDTQASRLSGSSLVSRLPPSFALRSDDQSIKR